jgi:two-component system chemotaxis response regulator CheY
MRILIVEDDFISRRLLCRYLEPHGECDVAVNGSEAVQAVRQSLEAGRAYDLICLDIMMPDLDGQEALRQIRNLEREKDEGAGARMRIIMTTALEDNDNVSQAFREQCDGYVTKPVDKKRFLQTLVDIGLPVTITPQR